jgi:hypothetical protein
LVGISLPLGWRKSNLGKFDRILFVNDKTSEKVDVRWKDPRLTATDLQKRSVSLE